MKKFLFFLLCAIIGFIPNAQSQLQVNENGQTLMGNFPLDDTSSSYSTLNVWDLTQTTGGSISFGAGNNANISGDGTLSQLILNSKKLSYLVGDKRIGMSFTDRDAAFNFTYDIKAPSFLTSSDARLKTNISSVDDISENIFNLNPVSYNLSHEADANIALIDSESTTMSTTNEDDRIHFGFVAQEVQEIFPNLVVEDEEGMLSIDYTGFIPLLVDAYKKMQEKVTAQEELIISLVNRLSPSLMPASLSHLYDEMPLLKQNKPNPFSTETLIECFLPDTVGIAYLYIYDLQGNQIKSIMIQERGQVDIKVEASSLSPGMYLYCLIADGNEIDSKRMIITN